MKDQIDPKLLDEQIKSVSDLLGYHAIGRGLFEKEIRNGKSLDELRHTVFALTSAYFTNVNFLYSMLIGQMNINKTLFELLSQQPDRSELEDFRNTMSNQVQQTLQPISDMIAKAAADAQRGSSVYG